MVVPWKRGGSAWMKMNTTVVRPQVGGSTLSHATWCLPQWYMYVTVEGNGGGNRIGGPPGGNRQASYRCRVPTGRCPQQYISTADGD
jgi:hypothetical protein